MCVCVLLEDRRRRQQRRWIGSFVCGRRGEFGFSSARSSSSCALLDAEDSGRKRSWVHHLQHHLQQHQHQHYHQHQQQQQQQRTLLSSLLGGAGSRRERTKIKLPWLLIFFFLVFCFLSFVFYAFRSGKLFFFLPVSYSSHRVWKWKSQLSCCRVLPCSSSEGIFSPGEIDQPFHFFQVRSGKKKNKKKKGIMPGGKPKVG